MCSSTFSSEWISSALSDLWSLHLAMIGCLVSVFTLLYSFIISKKEDLKLFVEQINRGGKSPTVLQKWYFAANYIRRMSRVANYCLILLACSVLFAIGSWCGLRILEGRSQRVALTIICLLTVLVFAFIIYLCVKVLKQYRDDTRI